VLAPGLRRLLTELARAVEQVLAAIEQARDVREHRRHLDDVHGRLETDPLADDAAIEPPKRTLALRW
jgi:hypothetical protein